MGIELRCSAGLRLRLQFNSHDFSSSGLALPPDQLHTLLKGVWEMALLSSFIEKSK